MTHKEKIKLLTNGGKYKSYAYSSSSNGYTTYYIYDERHYLSAEIAGEFVHYFITNFGCLCRVPLNMDALNELVDFVKSVKDVLEGE